MRTGWAIVLNVVVPGGGLIALRREWLGLAVAALFGVLGQVALLGLLMLPATIPMWLTAVCGGVAVVVWLGAQWLLWLRVRQATGPAVGRELGMLRRQAEEAVARQKYAEAEDLLRVALTLDDENLAVNVQWAETLTLMGQFRPARRAWRRVLYLDRSGQSRRRALEALATLPPA